MLPSPLKISGALVAGSLLVAVTACAPATESGSPEPTEAATPSSLSPTGALATDWSERLIDAPYKPEDLLKTSSGEIVVSAMAENPGESGSSGSLYFMDPDTTEISVAWPSQVVENNLDEGLFADCAGPLSEEETSPHGIAIESADAGAERLYVVNHGGRESIEVFEVSNDEGQPGLTWIGCVELPEGSFGNGVAADPNSEGFYVTHFLNPADMENDFRRAFAGEDTGHVLHWAPESGWTQLPESAMSTPNGIAVAEDGQSLYVASWGGRKLVEMDPVTGAILRETPVEVMADNLRFTGSGSVLVTGQVIDSFDTFVGYEFEGVEPEDRYDVIELAPDTFTATVFAEGSVEGFGNPTTALPVGDKVFVGAVAGTTILELSLP